MNVSLLRGLVFVAALVAALVYMATDFEPASSLRDIASDIAALKPRFPALQDFPDKPAPNNPTLSLSYSFHTHTAPQTGGWSAGVPEPDADGLWFYFNIHQSDSTAQIDTQPVAARLCFTWQHVTFLIREGAKTAPLEAELMKIFRRHGVRDCPRETRAPAPSHPPA